MFSFNTRDWDPNILICAVVRRWNNFGVRIRFMSSSITLLSQHFSVLKTEGHVNSHGTITQIRPDNARRPLLQTAEVSRRHSVSDSRWRAPCVHNAAWVCCTWRGARVELKASADINGRLLYRTSNQGINSAIKRAEKAAESASSNEIEREDRATRLEFFLFRTREECSRIM